MEVWKPLCFFLDFPGAVWTPCQKGHKTEKGGNGGGVCVPNMPLSEELLLADEVRTETPLAEMIFLGLIEMLTVKKEKGTQTQIFLAGDPSGDRGVSRPGVQGSKFYVLSSEPKEHKSFCPDTRPGGPVTGATGKSFMCKSFMCLFCALLTVKKVLTETIKLFLLWWWWWW